MYINKVLIYGNLTRDPEMQELPSGTKVVNVGVATNRVYNNKEGQKVEEVEFHNVVFFDRVAEIVAQYLRKGSGVFVEGRLRTRSWDDKESGKKMYRTEIIAGAMQLGPRRSGEGAQPRSESRQPSGGNEGKPDYPEATINPDDIPF